jgi:hypothetical protein
MSDDSPLKRRSLLAFFSTLGVAPKVAVVREIAKESTKSEIAEFLSEESTLNSTSNAPKQKPEWPSG